MSLWATGRPSRRTSPPGTPPTRGGERPPARRRRRAPARGSAPAGRPGTHSACWRQPPRGRHRRFRAPTARASAAPAAVRRPTAEIAVMARLHAGEPRAAVRHSTTLGTRYRPFSTAGAFAWLSSRWSGSVTTSSRWRSGARLRMRHRDHAGGVDRAQLLDDVEHLVELDQQGRLLRVVETDAGELAEPADVLWSEGHGASAIRSSVGRLEPARRRWYLPADGVDFAAVCFAASGRTEYNATCNRSAVPAAPKHQGIRKSIRYDSNDLLAMKSGDFPCWDSSKNTSPTTSQSTSGRPTR